MNGPLGAGIIFAILVTTATGEVMRVTFGFVALILAVTGCLVWIVDRVEKDKASRR